MVHVELQEMQDESQVLYLDTQLASPTVQVWYGPLRIQNYKYWEIGTCMDAQWEENGSVTYTFTSTLTDYIATVVYVFRVGFAIIGTIGILLLLSLWRSLICMTDELQMERASKKKMQLPIYILLTLLLAFSLALNYGYHYLQNSFANVSIEQLIYHIHTDLGGTNWDEFTSLFMELGGRIAIALVIGVFCILIYLYIHKKKSVKIAYKISLMMKYIILLISLGVMALIFVQFAKQYDLYGYLVRLQMKTTLYDDYYVDAKTADITFPTEKKNLIYIFMESMEITNADESVGGGKSFNDMTELTDIALENDCFNGTDKILNGGLTPGNTGWTVAGMAAQTAGVPLNVPVDGNEYQADEFLPGVYSLGEVLEQNGYRNYLMMGSDSSFGSRDNYFTQHGNYTIYDYKWALDTGVIPEDYNVWWGYEDIKIFDAAKAQILEAAESEEPFNFAMLTADTHFIDGYVCDECRDEFEQQYANVLACSSKQVSELVEWIGKQEFAADTVIVLSGDHLCMDSDYFADITEGYERKTYVTFINSQKEEPSTARTYTTMDLYPTTLSALGCTIAGDRLGIGTDLYSTTPTLVEIMGNDNLNYQMSLQSRYYDKNILYAD